MLGEAGVLGLPYPEEYGGSGQPYEVYLQALEEIASAWMTVGLGVSVHVMSSLPAGPVRHRRSSGRRFLPDMLGGRQLGAYALSEPQAGSDIAGMTSRAKPGGEGYAPERDQGLDHPRRAGRLLHHLRPQRARGASRSPASTCPATHRG